MDQETTQQLRSICKLTRSNFHQSIFALADVFTNVDAQGNGEYLIPDSEVRLSNSVAADRLAKNLRDEVIQDINKNLVLKSLLIQLLSKNLQIDITGSRVSMPTHSKDFDFNISSLQEVPSRTLFETIESLVSESFFITHVPIDNYTGGHIFAANSESERSNIAIILKHKESDLELSFALNPTDTSNRFVVKTSRRHEGHDPRLPNAFTSVMALSVDNKGDIYIDENQKGSSGWRDSIFVSPKGHLVYALGMENVQNLGFTQAIKLWKELKRRRVNYFLDHQLENRLRGYRVLVKERLYVGLYNGDNEFIMMSDIEDDNNAFHSQYLDVGRLILSIQILDRLKNHAYEDNIFMYNEILEDLKFYQRYNDSSLPEELRQLSQMLGSLKIINKDNVVQLIYSISNVLERYQVGKEKWERIFSNDDLNSSTMFFGYPLTAKVLENFTLKSLLWYEKILLGSIIALEIYSINQGLRFEGITRWSFIVPPLLVLLNLALIKNSRNQTLIRKQNEITEIALKNLKGGFHLKKSVKIKRI